MRASALAFSLLALGSVAGCGPSYPARYVVERDVGHLSYRRYQRVLDVEFPVAGNDAVGHTATYVGRSGVDRSGPRSGPDTIASARPAGHSGRGGEPPYVNVFVTVYDHAASLTAEVRHQVQSLESYDVEVADVGGGRAWRLDGGEGDRWIVWVSSRFVVKIGGTADDALTHDVVSTYMGIYPSDLDEHGRARDGAASAGDAVGEVGVDREEMEVPRSLGGEGDTTQTPATPPATTGGGT